MQPTDRLIERIVELSGPLPDAGRYARYLGTLPTDGLKQRLSDLLLETTKPPQQIEFWQAKAPVEFWRGKAPAATVQHGKLTADERR